ncbi:ras association domain-containing protein 1-like isoform X2 [Saccostrea echinata]|uniref:ras association domain-containing protein 1-like isoform X2 n=1 Tax=Saccostrea echinata TaxID=191078 RepID=UPI002A807240|nr:ras association domain-containing protein 1-like isoform X2 [Saccostrea echinata]
MARDFLESLFYDQMEQAVSGRGQQAQGVPNPGYGNMNGGGGWGWGKVFSSFMEAIGGSKRKSIEVPEAVDISSTGVEFGDHIEMAHFGHVELLIKGHDFVLQQLSNPTWCDECGDFIWGLYKHCLRCKYCHFTSHQKCAQLVRLPCKHSPDGIPLDDSSQEVEGLPNVSDVNQSASNETTSEATNEKDETDSGYRSGTIPDDKLPRKPSQATLNREELKKKLEEYNSLVPGADFKLHTEKGETFQGFVKVTLNLVRPICMSLGARPPSVYELLTNEHIVEQNTQTISFYMPRDTVKSIHITSDETTKDVISMLLKKFHILDNPRKFALYEQELNEKGKIAKLRRIQETEYPLHVSLLWDSDRIERTRFVLQENENGEIDWEAFSLPELSNFLRVLDREEQEYLTELKHKYKFMKKIVQQRLKELRIEKQQAAGSKRDSYIRPAGADHPLAQSS